MLSLGDQQVSDLDQRVQLDPIVLTAGGAIYSQVGVDA